MTQRNDGGPAFPIPCQYDVNCGPRFKSGYGGMSIRDYFAAKAMTAMVVSPDYVEGSWFQEDIAIQAYTMADAMLAARERS